MAVQTVVALLLTEAVDYIQHYGLMRAIDERLAKESLSARIIAGIADMQRVIGQPSILACIRTITNQHARLILNYRNTLKSMKCQCNMR